MKPNNLGGQTFEGEEVAVVSAYTNTLLRHPVMRDDEALQDFASRASNTAEGDELVCNSDETVIATDALMRTMLDGHVSSQQVVIAERLVLEFFGKDFKRGQGRADRARIKSWESMGDIAKIPGTDAYYRRQALLSLRARR